MSCWFAEAQQCRERIESSQHRGGRGGRGGAGGGAGAGPVHQLRLKKAENKN